MFEYFTDLEICLVSEQNLTSSFSSYRFRLGGLGRSGLFLDNIGGGGGV